MMADDSMLPFSPLRCRCHSCRYCHTLIARVDMRRVAGARAYYAEARHELLMLQARLMLLIYTAGECYA